MLRRHKLGMRGPLVKACRRTVYKRRLPVELDKPSRRPATLRSSRYGSPVQDVHAGREAELAASAHSSRPCPRPGPAASVDGGAGILECFGRGNETSSAGSIDDPSSILQSPCLRPGHSSIYRTTSAQSDLCCGRSTHSCTAEPCTAARRISARQIRHQSTCVTPSRSGEVRTGASWLFAQLERSATPRGGPPAEPRWSTAMPLSKHRRRPPNVTCRPTGCRPCRWRSSQSYDRGVR